MADIDPLPDKKITFDFLTEFSEEALLDLSEIVKKEIQRNQKKMQFPDKLEKLFIREITAERRTHLIRGIVLALIVFNIFLLTDYVILRDVFQVAVITRLLIVPLVVIILMLGLDFPLPAWVRDCVKAVITVGVSFSLIYLMALSNTREAIFYFPGIILMVIFGNNIIRLRFWFAVAASISILIIYLLYFPMIPGMPDEVQFAYVIVLVASILMTLYANFTFDKGYRQNYLLDLHERLRKRVLLEKNKMLAELSHIDALTGLANRREIDEFIVHLTEERISSLSIVMIDIDYFKNFNDFNGHPAGDECLQKIGKVLREEIHRKRDLVGRYGGEEFVILLPETSLADAKNVAERMRLTIKNTAIPHAASPISDVVSISAGVAFGDVDTMKDVQNILNLADTALYQAKSSGRDQVQG